jgi:riboflavin transporter FmnP
MTESRPPQRLTVTLAGAGVFAALAALLTLAKAAVPFPLIPYLQIDFSEIPIVIAFFLFGPLAAFISTGIQWLFLNVQGGDAPLGPALKFVALVSMLGGFWFGNQLYRRIRGDRVLPNLALSMVLSGGILLRIAVMTVANYAVLVYIGPLFFGADYLGFARFTLEKSTGLQLTNDVAVLTYTLLFTAVYNLVNLLVAAIPAGLIVSPITTSFKHITSIEAWLSRTKRS